MASLQVRYEDNAVRVQKGGKDRKGNRRFFLVYTEPATGVTKRKSAGTANIKEAERLAAKLEFELKAGIADSTSRCDWDTFESHYLATRETLVRRNELAEGSLDTIGRTFSKISQLLKPATVSRVTDNWIEQFVLALEQPHQIGNQKTLRPCKWETIKLHLRNLRTALRWAKSKGYIAKLPTFPNLQSGTNGATRAMTFEEFERMLDAVEKVVGPNQVESYKFILTGFWWSGMRLDEIMRLTWDEWSDDIRVIVIDEADVILHIPENGQKNQEEQTVGVAPEFADMLLAVPSIDRDGFVFNPRQAKSTARPSAKCVGRIITAIGERAGVKVGTEQKWNPSTQDWEKVPMYAKAHRLRSAFATRLASDNVGESNLQDLMRHKSIATTKKHYIRSDALKLSQSLRQKRTHSRTQRIKKSATTAAD
jgi:integrase